MTDLGQWIFVERGPREKSFLIEAESDWQTWKHGQKEKVRREMGQRGEKHRESLEMMQVG